MKYVLIAVMIIFTSDFFCNAESIKETPETVTEKTTTILRLHHHCLKRKEIIEETDRNGQGQQEKLIIRMPNKEEIPNLQANQKLRPIQC
ncbi:MAG: hypothetical protein U0586_07535 [Candidatus Brocadiaceae bacterium]